MYYIISCLVTQVFFGKKSLGGIKAQVQLETCYKLPSFARWAQHQCSEDQGAFPKAQKRVVQDGHPPANLRDVVQSCRPGRAISCYTMNMTWHTEYLHLICKWYSILKCPFLIHDSFLKLGCTQIGHNKYDIFLGGASFSKWGFNWEVPLKYRSLSIPWHQAETGNIKTCHQGVFQRDFPSAQPEMWPLEVCFVGLFPRSVSPKPNIPAFLKMQTVFEIWKTEPHTKLHPTRNLQVPLPA